MSDRAEVKILPPFVLAAALGLQVVVWILASARMMPGTVALLWGLAIIAGSILLAVLLAREIVHARTGFDVRKATTELITWEVFDFTRNPVYLWMVVLAIGVGLALNSYCSLLLAVPTGSALYLTAIKPEERYLEAKFSDAYRAYRDVVPRWFSVRRALSTV